ncbi:uncharacterized protein LOC114459069, partial [Gouania willdenowi]|uniref:uncharacterized protein LOC114459069 n=1 Tax=Gouania willdenowi TaxID=441366 RepID=UPI0010565383
MDSSDSTIILDRSTEGTGSPGSDGKERRRSQSLPEEAPSAFSSPDANKSADVDSPANLVRHYKTLQTLYKRKNPNHQDVSHLLDLEFVARRAFIDSNTVREEDRPKKVLEAYPCFKDIGHVMEELQRILDKDNANFINELKGRWHDFCQRVQFFGVCKKVLKPPMGMDKAEQALEILRVLPSLFPSSAPPKRVRDASEALVHVLEEAEDPNSYLKKCPLSCPVVIVCSSNCLLARTVNSIISEVQQYQAVLINALKERMRRVFEEHPERSPQLQDEALSVLDTFVDPFSANAYGQNKTYREIFDPVTPEEVVVSQKICWVKR